MNKTALIAASCFDERRALSDWLRHNEVTTQTADSGQDAMEHLVLATPDIVLAQVSMVDMSGLRLAHYLKAHDGFRDVPVVLLCQTEREMALVSGQWPAYRFEAPVNAELMSKLMRDLLN